MKLNKFIFILSLLIILICGISVVSAADVSEVNLDDGNLMDSSILVDNPVSEGSSPVIQNIEDNDTQLDDKINGKLSVNISGKYYKSTKLTINFINSVDGTPLCGEKIDVKFSNGKYVTLTTNSKGIATYNVPYAVGTYKVTVSSLNKDIDSDSVSTKFTIKKVSTKISASSVSTYYKSGKIFTVKLINSKSKDPVIGAKIKLKVYTGKKYKTVTLTTNSKGVASYSCSNLAVGSHKVVISSVESTKNLALSSKTLTKTIKIVKTTAKVSASSLTTSYKSDKLFTVKLINSKSKAPVIGAKIKLKVYTGKKYKTVTLTTDNDGVASYSSSLLAVGSHKVVISSGESSKNLVLSPKTLTKTIKINKAKTTLTVVDQYVSNGSSLKISLKSNNKALAGKVIRLAIGDDISKVYTQKTDSNGMASFVVEGNFIKYHITYYFDEDSNYLGSFVEGTFELIDGDNLIYVNNYSGLKEAINVLNNKSKDVYNNYYIVLKSNNYIADEPLTLDINGTLNLFGYDTKIMGDNSFSFINVVGSSLLILKNIKLSNFDTAIYNSANTYLENCVLSNNSGFSGSAIFNNVNANISVYDSIFNDNVGDLGSCIFSSEKASTLVFNSVFKDNFANNGAGIFNDVNSDLKVYNCEFINNFAKTNGGAIYNKGTAYSESNKYIKNYVRYNCGGAIYSYGPDSYLSSINDSFENNSANYTGGAIQVQYEASAYIENDTFINNRVLDGRGCGGAIANTIDSDSHIISSKFISNNAVKSGGAISNNKNAVLTLTDCTFDSNNAGTSAGAIYCADGSFSTLNTNTFTSNYADKGGVIYADSATITGNSNVFEDNSATNGGSVFVINNGLFNDFNSLFKSNYASSCGGAIYVEANGKVNVENSKFLSNKASSDGGSIYVYDANVTVISSEFDNSSATDGGDIAVYYQSYVYLKANKFTNSYAELGGSIQNYMQKRSNPLIVSMYDNIFENCESIYSGGAILNYNVTCFMNNNSFINCKAGNAGGAISNEALTSMEGSNNYFENNCAFNGGAISNVYAFVTLNNSIFKDNKAIVGCALYVDNSTLTMNNATFIGNNDTDIGSYALFDIDGSVININVSDESLDDLTLRNTPKIIDSITIPDEKDVVMANEDGIYTLTKDQYLATMEMDSYFYYLKQSLPKFVYFQDITGTWYKISREKWNVIEKEINTNMVLGNSMDKPKTITVDLEGKHSTYSMVRDQQNEDYTCGPTSVSMAFQFLKSYVNEKTLIPYSSCTYQDGSISSGLKMGIELLTYHDESLNGFSAQLLYSDKFDDAVNQLLKGDCAVVFHTTNHYVVIVGAYNDGNNTYLQVANPSGDYNHGSHDIPTNWIQKETLYSLFAPYDASVLVVKAKYNLSNEVIDALNQAYDNLGGKWDNYENMEERISDVGM